MDSGTRSNARSSGHSSSRSTTLQASRWAHLGRYVLSAALIPAAGLGLLLWSRTDRERRRYTIQVEDARLRIGDPADPGSHRVIELERIERVSVQRERHVSAWLGVRTVVITTPGGEIPLRGLADGEAIAEALRTAMRELGSRRRERPVAAATSSTVPGSTEQLNELALLWQQGLITDEQYQAERRRFS